MTQELRRVLFLVALAVASLHLYAQDDPLEAPGFVANKAYDVHDYDSVNMMSGNLLLTIPIGPAFHVNGGLKYGLALHYNSRLWYWHSDPNPFPPPDPSCGTGNPSWFCGISKADPLQRYNVALGWTLSLGRILLGVPEGGAVFAYEDPDGATHTFPAGSGTTVFSDDGSNLRMTMTLTSNGGIDLTQPIYVDSGDGVRRTFVTKNVGGLYPGMTARPMLSKISDAVGNHVDIDYSPDGLVWKITDVGRDDASHPITVTFTSGGATGTLPSVLSSVVMPGPNGQPLTYTFTTVPTDIALPDDATPPQGATPPFTVNVPLLTRIDRPVGQPFTFLSAGPEQYTDLGPAGTPGYNANVNDRDMPGVLLRMVTPTGAIYRWDHLEGLVSTASSPMKPAIEKPIQVQTRVVTDPITGQKSTWNYEYGAFVGRGCTKQNAYPYGRAGAVQRPDGTIEVSYYSVFRDQPCTNPDQFGNLWSRSDYGLPFTKGYSLYLFNGAVNTGVVPLNGKRLNPTAADPSNPAESDYQYLSSQTYGPNGQLLRSRYVAYDGDTVVYSAPTRPNARARTETTYQEDTQCVGSRTCYSTANRDDYRHFGNYATSVTTAIDLSTTKSRTVFRDYPSSVDNASAWVLDDPNEECVVDGAVTGIQHCLGIDNAFITLFDYDRQRNLLNGKRILRLNGSNPHPQLDAHDILIHYLHEDSGDASNFGTNGNVTMVKTEGGDQGSVGTSSNFPYSSTTPISLVHKYHYFGGAVDGLKSYYEDTNGPAFNLSDFSVQSWTGLITSSRDSAGLQTNYGFDDLGRLTQVTPPGGSTTAYAYHDTTTPISIDATTTKDSDGSVLKHQIYEYDGRGRLWHEKTFVGTGWSTRTTSYDAMSRVVATSPLQGSVLTCVSGDPCTFSTYEPLGRPAILTDPDGRTTTFQYLGDLKTTRTQQLTAGTFATSVETNDALGQLVTVVDPVSTQGDYTYDAAGHLTKVVVTDPTQLAGQPNQQTRIFNYDGRGFLTSEIHPEILASNTQPVVNGAVSYTYDAGGKMLTRRFPNPSPFDLNYTYDSAERVLQIFSRAGASFQAMKDFTYATSNGSYNNGTTVKTDYGLGKLATATRHNYQAGGDVQVTEKYHYADNAGHLTDRTTEVALNGTLKQSVRQSAEYNELGLPSRTILPTCPQHRDDNTPDGTLPPCVSPTTAAFTHAYAEGRETSVGSDAQSDAFATMTYSANEMLHTIAHSNGVADTIDPDAKWRPRPDSIKITTAGTVPPCTAPAIAGPGQPASKSVDYNQPATLTVTATGDSLEYQWYDADTNQAIAGATAATYVTPGVTSTRRFYVVVSSLCGSVKSDTAVVQICDTHVTTQPGDAFITSGDSKTLSVVAANSAGLPLTYQWYVGRTGDTTDQLAGATNATLTVSPAVTTSYWVRVTAQCSNDSVTATVHVCQPPTVDAGTTTYAILDSHNQGSATLQAVAQGDITAFIWRDTTNPSNPVTLTACTGALCTLAFVDTDKGTHTYSVEVDGTCDGGHPATTNFTVVVEQCGDEILGISPPRVTVAPDAPVYTITVNMTESANTQVNGVPKYEFHWYHGLGDQVLPVTGQNTSGGSLTVAASKPDAYWCEVTIHVAGGTCTKVTPKSYVEIFGIAGDTCPLPPVTIVPASATVTVQRTTFVASVDWPGITYQWYIGSSGDTTHPISTADGGTSQSYVALPESQAYWVRATNECGTLTEDSQTVTVTTNACPPTVILRQPQSVSAAAGATSILSVDANNTVPLVYQWYTNDAAHTPSGNSAQVPVHPSVTTSYYAEITKPCGSAGDVATTVNGNLTKSTPAWVYVTSCSDLTVTTQPVPLTTVPTNTSVHLFVVANSSQAITYTWYQGTVGDTDPAKIVKQGPDAYLDVTAGTADATYWVRMTAGTCTVDSYLAKIRICQPTTLSFWPGNSLTIRYLYSVTVSAVATGTDLTYQWYKGHLNDRSQPLAGFSTWPYRTFSPLDTTTYWVEVTGVCGMASAEMTIYVCDTPVITAQPQSVLTFLNHTTTLHVSATESKSTPLTYQWYSDSGPVDPVGSPSARTDTFTTPALTGAQVPAHYWVRVACTEICNPVISSTASVDLCPLGETIAGPPDVVLPAGQSVRLTIPPLSPVVASDYQWWSCSVPQCTSPLLAVDWQNTYNYIDVQPAQTKYYFAKVRNNTTCISKTGVTTVTVCTPPSIGTQPGNIQISPNGNATLTVAAGPTGVTYQWYQGSAGDTSHPVGSGSSSFNTGSLTATTSYWVRISTSTCGSVNSQTATVTVCYPPDITNPASGSITLGNNVVLSVSGTGTGLTFQWYRGLSGDKSHPLTGATTSNVTVQPSVPTDYWVEGVGTCGTKQSTTSHISVCTTPNVITQPQSTSIFSGTSTTLTVAASESTGEPLHYQWFNTATGTVGTDSPTLNTGTLTANASYYVTVTAGGLCSATSATATVSICTYPQTVTGPASQNTSPGVSARLTITSTPAATAYRWFQGASGNTSNPIGGFQAQNYLDAVVSTTTTYWAQVQAGSCVSNSTAGTINVCIPGITQQPASTTVSAGSPATLSVASNLTGSTYQWYIGTSGTTTSPISGATSSSVTVTPSATTNYWCRVTGPCGTANSNTATVTVCATVITQQPVTQGVFINTAASLHVTATGSNLTYQWYRGASGDTTNPVTGSGSTFAITPQSYTSYQYWVRVTGTCGSVNSIKDSNAVWIAVSPGITTQPQATTYLMQGSRGMLTVAAQGTSMHYIWFSASGPVSGAPDSPTFVTPDVNTSTYFYCVITAVGVASTTSQFANFYFCDGASPASVTVYNLGGNCRNLAVTTSASYDTVTWYQGQRGDTSVPIGSGNAYQQVCPSTSTTYWYRLTNYDANLGVSCYSDSNAVTVP